MHPHCFTKHRLFSLLHPREHKNPSVLNCHRARPFQASQRRRYAALDSSRLSTVRLPCNFRSVSRQDVARSETLSPAWRLALIRYRHRPRRQWYAPTWSLLGACITWGTSAFHTPCPKFYAEASISGQAFARTVQHQAHCRHTALAGEMCSSYHPYARLQPLPDS